MLKYGLQSFLTYLDKERRLSPATVSAYHSDIDQFLDFLGDDAALAPDVLQQFSRYLGKREYSARSISRKLSSIQAFLQHLQASGQLAATLNFHAHSPKQGKRLPRVLSPEQIEAMIQKVGEDSDFPYRDRAMLDMLYSCGCRVSEVSILRRQSLARPGLVKIHGKGNKERQVPVGKYLQHELDGYLRKEYPRLQKEKSGDALFLSRHGKSVSRQFVYNLVKKAAKMAGITGDVGPHTLRHSFATHLLAGDANIRDVQLLLGHEDISSTQIYTQVDRSQLKAAYRDAHPLA